MKRLYYILFSFIVMIPQGLAISSDDLKASITPPTGDGVLSSNTASQSGEAFLDSILLFIKDTTFALIALVAIGVFLFIGARLIVARGNPEEFKKALQSFIYAAIGIFVVAAAWAIVKLVAGINI